LNVTVPPPKASPVWSSRLITNVIRPKSGKTRAFQWALVNEQNAIWKYSSCIFHDCLLIDESAAYTTPRSSSELNQFVGSL